ncbi:MAG: arsenate reductase ArsC [Planctomycetes bacterium]|nr:arsenate reductase ArsC [Planctomycetota bacterium]
MSRASVLFLCTGNSCRSQMAEGWAKYFFADRLDVYSAGIEAHGLNPHALAVMAEAGVDISKQQSQVITEFSDQAIDTVITVCGHAHENCPVFPGQAKVIHHGFDDPPKLAANAVDDESALNCYREVRDAVKNYVQTLADVLSF